MIEICKKNKKLFLLTAGLVFLLFFICLLVFNRNNAGGLTQFADNIKYTDENGSVHTVNHVIDERGKAEFPEFDSARNYRLSEDDGSQWRIIDSKQLESSTVYISGHVNIILANHEYQYATGPNAGKKYLAGSELLVKNIFSDTKKGAKPADLHLYAEEVSGDLRWQSYLQVRNIVSVQSLTFHSGNFETGIRTVAGEPDTGKHDMGDYIFADNMNFISKISSYNIESIKGSNTLNIENGNISVDAGIIGFNKINISGGNTNVRNVGVIFGKEINISGGSLSADNNLNLYDGAVVSQGNTYEEITVNISGGNVTVNSPQTMHSFSGTEVNLSGGILTARSGEMNGAHSIGDGTCPLFMDPNTSGILYTNSVGSTSYLYGGLMFLDNGISKHNGGIIKVSGNITLPAGKPFSVPNTGGFELLDGSKLTVNSDIYFTAGSKFTMSRTAALIGFWHFSSDIPYDLKIVNKSEDSVEISAKPAVTSQYLDYTLYKVLDNGQKQKVSVAEGYDDCTFTDLEPAQDYVVEVQGAQAGVFQKTDPATIKFSTELKYSFTANKNEMVATYKDPTPDYMELKFTNMSGKLLTIEAMDVSGASIEIVTGAGLDIPVGTVPYIIGIKTTGTENLDVGKFDFSVKIKYKMRDLEGSITHPVTIVVNKGRQKIVVPMITTLYGEHKKLQDVTLPAVSAGKLVFEEEDYTFIGDVGYRTHKLKYVPNDTDHYEIIDNVADGIFVLPLDGDKAPDYVPLVDTYDVNYGENSYDIDLRESGWSFFFPSQTFTVIGSIDVPVIFHSYRYEYAPVVTTVKIVVHPLNITNKTIKIPSFTYPKYNKKFPVQVVKTSQWTATIKWSPSNKKKRFRRGKVYTATITITPNEGYILDNISKNFFVYKYKYAKTTNAKGSNKVIIKFRKIKK